MNVVHFFIYKIKQLTQYTKINTKSNHIIAMYIAYRYQIYRVISMIKKINWGLWKWVDLMIQLYQKTLSPDKWILSPLLKWRVCAHEPHCSAYGRECMKRYGFRPWIAYTAHRIISCTPSMTTKKDPSHYRIVYFSGSPIWVPFLQELYQDPRFDVVGVVTMPDKTIWRWQQIQPNIIKQTAKDLWISTIYDRNALKKKNKDGAYDTIPTIITQLESLQADYFVVVAYGKIMPWDILSIPSQCSINVHWSLLPAYRGASPLQTVFLDNQTKTGLMVMKMSEKMDEWDIVSTHSFPLPFSRTSKELFEKVMEIGPKMLADALRDLGKWHITSTPQDHSKATYCKKIEKQDWYIDLYNTPLAEVYAKYRAYKLWPKIWTTWDGKNEKLRGKTIIIEEMQCDENLFGAHKDAPTILADGSLNPAIVLLMVKPEGKKSMLWGEFVNGYLR